MGSVCALELTSNAEHYHYIVLSHCNATEKGVAGSFPCVLSISNTFANKTRRMSLIHFCPKQDPCCACLFVLSVCSAHCQPRQTKRESTSSHVRTTLSIWAMFVWPLFGRHTPRTLAALTIRSERGPVQMGFPRREAEEVAVYHPPPHPPATDRPLPPACPSGHCRRGGNLRAEPGNTGGI